MPERVIVNGKEKFEEMQERQKKAFAGFLNLVKIYQKTEDPELTENQTNFIKDFILVFENMIPVFGQLKNPLMVGYISMLLSIMVEGAKEMETIEKVVHLYFESIKNAKDIVDARNLDALFKDIVVKQ